MTACHEATVEACSAVPGSIGKAQHLCISHWLQWIVKKPERATEKHSSVAVKLSAEIKN